MDLRAIAGKSYSAFPKDYWGLIMILFSVISRTRVGGGSLTPSQRWRQSIQQHLPIGLIWLCFFVFVLWPTNVRELFNSKAIDAEQPWCYWTNGSGDTEVHAFFKSISPKENIIVWLEFELTYYDVTVQHYNHYATGIPTPPLAKRALRMV